MNGKYRTAPSTMAPKKKGDPKMLGSKMYGTTSSIPGQHDNHWLEYSSLLSTDVSNINGVAAAIVILTDKNAYAAISTDWTATGTRKTGGHGTREQDNLGFNRRRLQCG